MILLFLELINLYVYLFNIFQFFSNFKLIKLKVLKNFKKLILEKIYQLYSFN